MSARLLARSGIGRLPYPFHAPSLEPHPMLTYLCQREDDVTKCGQREGPERRGGLDAVPRSLSGVWLIRSYRARLERRRAFTRRNEGLVARLHFNGHFAAGLRVPVARSG